MRAIPTAALLLATTGCLVGVDPAEEFATSGNKAPRVGGLEVGFATGGAPAPGTPATSRTPLVCRPSALSDPDGDALTVLVQWLADGQVVQESTTDDPLTIGAVEHQLAEPERGWQVTCRLEVSDDRFTTDAVSEPTLVGNAPPTTLVVADTPEIFGNEAASCQALPTDADGDPTIATWAWRYTDGAVVGPSDDDADQSTLPAGSVDRVSDVDLVEITCGAEVSDGQGGIAADSASVVVRNSPPAVVEADLSDLEPANDDVLVATAEAVDPEGNDLSLSWSWRVDGFEVSTGSDTLDLATVDDAGPGSFVQARVVASDAFGEGEPVFTQAAVITNENPRVDLAAIVPEAPTGLDDLTVVVTASDPEGEPLTFDYLWTINGEEVGQTSDTLPAGLYSKGDVVSVQITARDPSGAVGTGFTGVVVVDAPPLAPTVEVDPTYVWSDSTAIPAYAALNPARTIVGVTCRLSEPAFDLDDDPIEYVYRLVRVSDGVTVHTGDAIDSDEYGLPVTTLDDYRCEVEAIADGVSAPIAASGTTTPIELVDLPWYRLGALTSCARLTADDGGQPVDIVECWDGNSDLLGSLLLDSPAVVAGQDAIVDASTNAGVGCVTTAAMGAGQGIADATLVCPVVGGAPADPATYTAAFRDGRWVGDRPRMAANGEGVCALQTGGDFQCWGDALNVESWCATYWVTNGLTDVACPADAQGGDRARLLDQVGPLPSYENGFCASQPVLKVLSPAFGLGVLSDSAACYDFADFDPDPDSALDVVPQLEFSAPILVEQLSVGWSGQAGCGVDGTGGLLCFGVGGLGQNAFDPRRFYTSAAVVQPGNGVAFIAAVEAGGRVWVSTVGSTVPAQPTDDRMLWLDPGRTAACGSNLEGDWVCVTDGGQPGRDVVPPLDLVRRIETTDAVGQQGEPNICRVLEPDGRLTCDVWRGDGVAPPVDLVGVTELDITTDSGCAISAGGVTTCWGDPTVVDSVPATPFVDVALSAGLSGFGGDAACGLEASGTIRCWHGTDAAVYPGPYAALAQSGAQVCGVTFQGNITCFDCPTNVLNGYFEACDTYTPPFPVFGVAAAASDGRLGCVVETSGELVCWDAYGDAVLVDPGPWADVGTGGPLSVGEVQACALSDAGQLECWKLGLVDASTFTYDFVDGTVQTDRASIVPLQTADLSGQACGVDIDQREVCWNGAVIRRTLIDGAPLITTP